MPDRDQRTERLIPPEATDQYLKGDITLDQLTQLVDDDYEGRHRQPRRTLAQRFLRRGVSQ